MYTILRIVKKIKLGCGYLSYPQPNFVFNT